MNFARIRKAIVAGVSAAVAALSTGLVAAAQGDGLTQEAVSAAIGLAVATGVAVGWTTWRVPNAPEVSAGESEQAR